MAVYDTQITVTWSVSTPWPADNKSNIKASLASGLSPETAGNAESLSMSARGRLWAFKCQVVIAVGLYFEKQKQKKHIQQLQKQQICCGSLNIGPAFWLRDILLTMLNDVMWSSGVT